MLPEAEVAPNAPAEMDDRAFIEGISNGSIEASQENLRKAHDILGLSQQMKNQNSRRKWGEASKQAAQLFLNGKNKDEIGEVVKLQRKAIKPVKIDAPAERSGVNKTLYKYITGTTKPVAQQSTGERLKTLGNVLTAGALWHLFE